MTSMPSFTYDKAASDLRKLSGGDHRQRRETIVAQLLSGAIRPDTADRALNGDGPALVKAAFRVAELIMSESDR